MLSASGQEVASVEKFEIKIIQGDNVVNHVKRHVATEPVVEVTDQNHKPVAGAVVTFTFPSGSAPGASGVDGSSFVTDTTDENGRAAATGIRANAHSGTFKVHVRASFGGKAVAATVTQTNVVGGMLGRGVGVTTAAVVGGAAAATAVAVAVVKLTSGSDAKRVKISVGPPSLP